MRTPGGAGTNPYFSLSVDFGTTLFPLRVLQLVLSLMLVAMGLLISVTGRALPRMVSLSRFTWRVEPRVTITPAVRLAGVAVLLLGLGGVILAGGGYSRLAYGFAGLAIASGLLAFGFLIPYFLLPGRPGRERRGQPRAPIFIASTVLGFALAEFIFLWILQTRR